VSQDSAPTITAFGQQLLELLHNAGYATPTALARDAGLTPSMLGRWIYGKNLPTAAALRKVAPLLGVPVGDLIAAAYPTGDQPDLSPPREIIRPPDVPMTLGRQVDAWLHPESDLSPRGRDHLRKLINAAIYFAEQEAVSGSKGGPRWVEAPAPDVEKVRDAVR
jgi:transcriptional regulator with XRE-family HTH domain